MSVPDTYKLTFANIVDTAMNALKNNASLNAWCMMNYGRVPAIFNELNPMDPPQERDCPFIAVTPVGGANGQDNATYQRGFLVHVAISDNVVVENHDETGRCIWREYRGTKNISYLLEGLVYPCIADAFNDKDYPVSTESEEIMSPDITLFEARASLIINFDKCLGEDVPYLA